MDADLIGGNEAQAAGAAKIAELRQFAGAGKDFWGRFLAAAAVVSAADFAVLLLGRTGQTPRWTKIGEWSSGSGRPRLRSAFLGELEDTAERCLAEGKLIEEDEATQDVFTMAIRLKLLNPDEQVVFAGQFVDFNGAAARDSLARLDLVADTPAIYQANLARIQAQNDVEKFATVLDMMVPVSGEKHFLAALMALCNGVATRLHAERVSLGWLEGGYVRLKAISRTEKFERKMAAAQMLEAAMDECLDQDEEILWPSREGTSAVTRDHEKFAREQVVVNLCSIPIRVEAKTVAVLTCERQNGAFSGIELDQLRLCCDQLAARLGDLKKHDCWFGARWLAATREFCGRMVGLENTWAKVIGISISLLIAALFLVRVDYRVEGNFMLRGDEVSYLSAPFDGYIERVLVRPGDTIKKGEELARLNRSELLLEQSSAQAELTRNLREAEKARANKALGEMRIAEALAEQAKARLDLVSYRLDHAVLAAAFEGAIVEGDLRERIGSPVKQGEVLYKVARLDSLYAEAEVNERDIGEISAGDKVEIAFVAQPRLTFPAVIQMIEPAAVPKKDANVFMVRLRPADGTTTWWRPGMTGICKITTGKRTLFWILTHRTADFLRLKLWW